MSSNSKSVQIDLVLMFPVFLFCLSSDIVFHNGFSGFLSNVSLVLYAACTMFIVILSVMMLIMPNKVTVTRTDNLKNVSKKTVRDVSIVESSLIGMLILSIQHDYVLYASFSVVTQVCVVIMFMYAQLKLKNPE